MTQVYQTFGYNGSHGYSKKNALDEIPNLTQEQEQWLERTHNYKMCQGFKDYYRSY